MSEQTVTATPAQRAVLRRLEKSRDRIARLRTDLQGQYDRRLSDLEAARQTVPPVLVRDICAAAGITEEAYRKILAKAKETRERNGGG